MPQIDPLFTPLKLFKNAFVSTVYSGLFRRIKIHQNRERIKLSDGDFLDLDCCFILLWSIIN